MDMAGFAINLKRIFHYKNAVFTYKVPRGYQESVLLKHLGVTISDLEPKADLCTKVRIFLFLYIYADIVFLTLNTPVEKERKVS